MSYPAVLNEFKTLEEIERGKSIARFGDGELKVMCGAGYAREEPNVKLAKELRAVLNAPPRSLLIGVPTMDPNGPKFQNWTAHHARFCRVLPLHNRYGSAFITRPDSAPWINNRAFAERMQGLWAGKRVALVAEPTTKLVRLVSKRALEVKHVECLRYGAYSQIDQLQAKVSELRPDIALLSCGPTATCLSARLCAAGLHSIDIGSAGGFLTRLLIA